MPMAPRPSTAVPPPPPAASQVTEKVVWPRPPAGTVTVRGFAPLTVQWPGTSLSVTV